MKNIIALFLLFTCLMACSNEEPKTCEEEIACLDEMYLELVALSESVNCNDANLWSFSSYGSKACGGPLGFIAYSSEIDTAAFLAKLAEHRSAQDMINISCSIDSDCSVPNPPTGIRCEDGKPVFVY